MSTTSLNETIAPHYDHLTKSSRKIADYLLAHAEEAQYLSISSLARECGVAEATIFRFCRALGFDGYNGLKIALAQTTAVMAPSFNYEVYGTVQPDDDMETLCARVFTSNMESLVKTRALLNAESITRAVDLLEQANRVYCLGQGGSLLIAMDVWSRFLTISDKFYNVQDSHLQAITVSLLGPEDVILYFSYSGSTRESVDLLRIAKKRGVRVILVTRYGDSPAAAQSDAVLLLGGSEGPLQGGSIGAKVSMLFAADILVNEFTRRDMDTIVNNRNLTTGALSNKLL